MTGIVMRREGNRLAPANSLAEDDFQAIPNDTELLVKITTPRNIKQFNLGWALAQKVSEACDWLADKDVAMEWLLLRARHVKYVQRPGGNMEIIPKSIALESMKQAEFDRLFKRLVHIVLTEIMPGVEEGELKREIFLMVGAAP